MIVVIFIAIEMSETDTSTRNSRPDPEICTGHSLRSGDSVREILAA